MQEANIQFENDYLSRWNEENSSKERYRQAPTETEKYPASAGLYRISLLGEDETGIIEENGLMSSLIGIENDIDRQIDKLLEIKGNEPINLLDFGGMLGLSFIRIASKRKELIERGKLKLFVSNLAFLPNMEQVDENGYSGIARLLNTNQKYDFFSSKQNPPYYSAEELNFINQQQQLVTFLQSDATELLNMPELIGKIDIIHEEKAVIHSRIPDSVLPMMGRLLSESGIIMLGSDESMYERIRLEKEKAAQRKKAFRTGVINLQFMTQAKQSSSLEAPYAIFVKSSAPNIFKNAT